MKSSVFRSRRNEDGRWQLRSGAGSEFHADGPATAKLRGPYRTVFVTGTASSPRAAERRRTALVTSQRRGADVESWLKALTWRHIGAS